MEVTVPELFVVHLRSKLKYRLLVGSLGGEPFRVGCRVLDTIYLMYYAIIGAQQMTIM